MNDKDFIPDKNGCYLFSKGLNQCCCACIHHKPTHEHCATNTFLRNQIEKMMDGKSKCICGIQNGWACCLENDQNRIYTNWPEHSGGCEMFKKEVEI